MVSIEQLGIASIIHNVIERRDSRLLVAHLREGRKVTPELAKLIADLLEGTVKANPNRKPKKPNAIMVRETLDHLTWFIRGEIIPCSHAQWPLPSDREIAYLLDCKAAKKRLSDDHPDAGQARAAVAEFWRKRPNLVSTGDLNADGKRLLPYLFSMCGWLASGQMPPWTDPMRERPSGDDIVAALKSIGLTEIPEKKGEITAAAKKLTGRMWNMSDSQLDAVLIPRTRKAVKTQSQIHGKLAEGT